MTEVSTKALISGIIVAAGLFVFAGMAIERRLDGLYLRSNVSDLQAQLDNCEKDLPRKYTCVLQPVPNIPENEKPVKSSEIDNAILEATKPVPKKGEKKR